MSRKALTIMGVLMTIASLLTGCSGKKSDPVIFNYDDYPENFIVQMQPDTLYTLVRNGEEKVFQANVDARRKKNQFMTFGEKQVDISGMLYFADRDVFLIHCNDIDAVWFVEKDKENTIASIGCYRFYENGNYAYDNTTKGFLYKEGDVLDPTCFLMLKNIDCFGHVQTKECYTIDELGKPEEIGGGLDYYFVTDEFAEERFVLENDIKAWVFADKDAVESVVEEIPAGTVFTRFRVPKEGEYSYVDALLEDGRVMRVIEEYWFSEPDPYQAMLDVDANQFNFSKVWE